MKQERIVSRYGTGWLPQPDKFRVCEYDQRGIFRMIGELYNTKEEAEKEAERLTTLLNKTTK